ncbi:MULTISPECIES: uroporphyrinogen-III synthase [unclassified Marinobacter]|uniref:uroporphyrinogen-III synthase n=1 Tax=unclassified Marinobacter TaxID=83889 RepID=UPI0026E47ADA|nr:MULTISPECIES: uroporphyrinogen-III synthase [unclassified Marinobacter]MDO6443518.1 uroporphyrinogen-III synthase [Marinobacter sp. 2_MG-2023]MDO6824097.1 uroporphyrinogen-III synthase [Marinobacter sp. 1_MG-2023]
MVIPRTDPTSLAGRRVLICRPEPEASRLARQFQVAGAEALVFPLLEREPLAETPERRSTILSLDEFTHIIAVSPYAARLLLEELDIWWPQLPMGLNWYGVGAGTAKVLAEHGLKPRKPEEGWTSEALLKLPSLAELNGERVLVARGEEGRELIRKTLEARGARVTPMPLYRRFCPDYSATQVQRALDQFAPEAIIALSGETLNNLIALSANCSHNLYDSSVIVPARRIADQARAAGFNAPCIPGSLADKDIVAAVTEQLAGQDGGSGKAK